MTDSTEIRLEVDGQLLVGVLEGSDDRARPMVVYLHGLGSRALGTKGEFFSRRFTGGGAPFCRFDLRGHGGSGGELGQVTVERNLDDLAAMIAELQRRGWTRFVLAGSSYGALTALVFACRHPELVVAGAFVAPAVGVADSIRRREGQQRLRQWRAAGEAPLTGGEGTLAWGFFEDAERWPPEEIAGRLAVPCLLFHGLKDDQVEWRGVHELARRSEVIQLHGFIEGGHRLIEHLPRIWEETERFLRGVGVTGDR